MQPRRHGFGSGPYASKLTDDTPFNKGDSLVPRCNRRIIAFKNFLYVLDKSRQENL